MAATADTTASLRPIDPGARVVLIEKGQPQVVIDPVQHPRADSKQTALDCSKFNAVIVDVIASGPNTQTTAVTVLGSPFNGEPWLQEWDPNAFQTVPAGTNKRFLVTGVSAWVAVALSAPMNWRVVLTPLDAPAQSTINITGTSNLNIAQIGGVAVSPANPLPVAQTAIVNTNTDQVGGTNLVLGQATSALSLPVVVASNQTPLVVSTGFLAAGQVARSFVGRVQSAINLTVAGVPTLAGGAAGAPNGTYRCAVTFVTATGETSGGAEATVTVVNQRISWSAIPLGPAGTTARNLYRTVAAGPVGAERFAATLADNLTTAFSDNISDATIAAAAAMPTVNTSGNTLVALGVVTASKTLIVTDIMLSTDSATQIDIRLQAAAVDIFRQFVRDLAPVHLPGIETQPNAAGGQSVTLVVPGTPAAQSVIYTIEAIES